MVFATPGTGFQVSGATTDAGMGPVDFGNINARHTATFAPFSAQRLFTSLGSNVIDLTFFIPGSTTLALTRGFGAVFTDVDLASTTSIQLFDSANLSLGTFFVPGGFGAETFSFLGISFPDAVISRVRITSGNAVLTAGVNDQDGGNIDLVVLDDFIYGDPVPGPSTVLLLLAAGALPIARLIRRRRAAG